MRKKHLLITVITALLLAISSAYATPTQEQGITVAIEMQDDILVANVSLTLGASPSEAWEVLTDYDHMTVFLPNMEFSKKINGEGNKILVEQKGKTYFGPFSFSFDSVAEVTLTPYREIQSRLISGSFRKLDALLQLVPEDTVTHIVYRSEIQPNILLPRAITIAITKRFIREQFESLKTEILRRKAAK